MNETERKMLIYDYITKPEKLCKDLEEFSDSFKAFVVLFENTEVISKMNTSDIFNVLCDMKEFNERIKPFVIKYGIVMNLDKVTN